MLGFFIFWGLLFMRIYLPEHFFFWLEEEGDLEGLDSIDALATGTLPHQNVSQSNQILTKN